MKAAVVEKPGKLVIKDVPTTVLLLEERFAEYAVTTIPDGDYVHRR